MLGDGTDVTPGVASSEPQQRHDTGNQNHCQQQAEGKCGRRTHDATLPAELHRGRDRPLTIIVVTTVGQHHLVTSGEVQIISG